ncbi:MAG: two-component system, cell cycle response regulator [Chloroflexota bacterium]|jgi:diguanylate cyclase (GGDEF)-like protein|nr:two-component system, cell cycle response regulator [Chloroflexota bacterium]
MASESVGSASDYPGDVLNALAIGLAADTTESGKKALDVVRARSPELMRVSEQTGEDLLATSTSFIEVLLMSLRSDIDLPWSALEQRARDEGRLRAAQGVALEALIEVVSIYRRATLELIAAPLEASRRRDEILTVAQRRLADVVERLMSRIAQGYLDHLDAEHRARESELYGLAAIVTAMVRSTDTIESAEIALIESLTALRLNAGSMWLRERASYKLIHTVGIDADQIDDFRTHVGPRAKATASANGRSESRVDRVVGGEWTALRAQLRVKGRTVGVMTVGTQMQRVFGPTDYLFMAAVADQVAIVLDRARQFSTESRTDHLTGLANRREFERFMEREVALAERHDRRLTMMMIDLDNLKRINDRQGHRGGDAALRLVGQQLLRVVRASDLCARIGGDEFAIVMPETSLDRGREVAARFKSAVREMSLAAKSVEAVDVSVGLSAWHPGQDWQAVYQSADMDLYEDKKRQKLARRSDKGNVRVPVRLFGRAGGIRRRVAGS